MKKIFFILIILAVLLLAGCDAMLESFYPEFADNFDGSNVVDIEYQLSDFHYGVLVGSNQPLLISIYAVGEDPMTGDTPLSTIDFYDKSGWWTFYVDNQNYDIWLWCDVDNNSAVNTGDIKSKLPININFTGTDGYNYKYLSQTDFESVL